MPDRENHRRDTNSPSDISFFLEMILNGIPEPIFVKDESHRWIFLNEAYCRFMGYSRDELIGKSDFDFFPEEEAKVFWQKDDVVFDSGEENVNEELFTDSHGNTHIILTKKKAFIDTNGRKILCGIISDITDSKNLEQERIKAGKLESVGLLAGGIAHDFNNILTGIIGYIAIARAAIKTDHPVLDYLRKAEEAVLRAKGLTMQLLTFAKSGSPIKKVVTVGLIVREYAELALRGSSVKCEFLIPDNLWTVEIDTSQIGQVVNNLVLNSVQASPQGGKILISATNVPLKDRQIHMLQKGDYIKISIQDFGTGIPRDHLEKVFDPYFTTKPKGSGLGLTTSYSIIVKHDGYLALTSEVSKGTRADIYLPVSRKPLDQQSAKEFKLIKGSGKILLMDDDKVVREVTGAMVKRLGYHVETAERGEETIEMYRRSLEKQDPFDILIMDLTIAGGMGGVETLKQIRKLNPDVMAIVSSGYSNDPALSKYDQYGFSGCLVKPYRIEELSEVLNAVMISRIN